MGFRGFINVILRKQIGMSRSFSLFHPSTTTRRSSRAICFLNSSYLFKWHWLHRSLPFPKKKKSEKKNVTLDPRHGTLALDMEPSILDPRQKDRLTKPSDPGNTLVTRPIGHWCRGTLSSVISTSSPVCKFLCVLCHFWRSCKEGMYSLSQRFQ